MLCRLCECQNVVSIGFSMLCQFIEKEVKEWITAHAVLGDMPGIAYHAGLVGFEIPCRRIRVIAQVPDSVADTLPGGRLGQRIVIDDVRNGCDRYAGIGGHIAYGDV